MQPSVVEINRRSCHGTTLQLVQPDPVNLVLPFTDSISESLESIVATPPLSQQKNP